MVLGVVFLGIATGCGKKSAPPTATPPVVELPPGATAPATPAAAAPTAAPNGLSQPDGSVDLPELQRTVIRWVVSNHRRPASFEDFAATAGAAIPPPPQGKKYIITHDLHVQLVNQ